MDIQNLFVMALPLALMVVMVAILWRQRQINLRLGDQIRVKSDRKAEMIQNFKQAVIGPLLIFLKENGEACLVERDGVWAIVRKFDEVTLVEISFVYREVHGCEDPEVVCELKAGWRHKPVAHYGFNELPQILEICMCATQIEPFVGGVMSADYGGACGEYVRPTSDVRNLSRAVQYSKVPS